MEEYIFWHELLSNTDNCVQYAEKMYKNHLKKCSKNYHFICNLDINYELLEQNDLKKQKFFSSSFETNKDVLKYFDNNELVQKEITSDYDCYSIITQKLNLTEKTHISLNIQEPNGVIGVHRDVYNKFFNKFFGYRCGSVSYPVLPENQIKINEMKRFIVFCDDWNQGQVFMIGDSCITNWKKGDVFSFPWYMPHSTANASKSKRSLLVVTGQQKTI